MIRKIVSKDEENTNKRMYERIGYKRNANASWISFSVNDLAFISVHCPYLRFHCDVFMEKRKGLKQHTIKLYKRSTKHSDTGE